LLSSGFTKSGEKEDNLILLLPYLSPIDISKIIHPFLSNFLITSGHCIIIFLYLPHRVNVFSMKKLGVFVSIEKLDFSSLACNQSALVFNLRDFYFFNIKFLFLSFKEFTSTYLASSRKLKPSLEYNASNLSSTSLRSIPSLVFFEIEKSIEAYLDSLQIVSQPIL